MNAPRPIVHIIEDDQALRMALERLFRASDIIAHTYPSPQAFFAQPWIDAPGCLLIDVKLPGLDGLEFYEKLKAHQVTLPAIMMTGFGDIRMSVRAMKAGAVDFLAKPFHEQELLDAVAAALARDAEQRTMEAHTQELYGRLSTLTGRERQVFDLVVKGRLNKQIAGDLGLSEITVKVHRGSVMRKMRVRSLAELARQAQQLSL